MGLRFVPGSGTAAVRPSASEHGRPTLSALGGGSVHLSLRLGCGHGGRPSLSASAFRARAVVMDRARDRRNFYERLGISEGVGFDDIKRAYKSMARKYHPDVSPPDRREEYTRQFIEVHEAYETLSDPHLRALYDRDLARRLHLSLDEEVEKSDWRRHWQDQLSELKRRSRTKDSNGKLSWGTHMRRERAE